MFEETKYQKAEWETLEQERRKKLANIKKGIIKENMEDIFFSVFMCVYNHTELLQQAINSVLQQSEPSFELLILDNSDHNKENTWKILTENSIKDLRVKIFQSSENVGWAKGASILLEKAQGKYMTFLAADDFLLPEALEKVKKAAEQCNPDVLWIGNKFYQYEAKTADQLSQTLQNQETVLDFYHEIGEAIPQKQMLLKGPQVENIKYVMEHVFYNAFFHFERIEFLKEKGIDFFESGYGDCAGMTRVLTQAGQMLILDQALYGLTANTSQSRGTFYWNGEQYIFSDQWQSVKKAYMEEARFSFHELRYCAMAILKNEIGNIVSLANGSKCVNRFMNPVKRDFSERLSQIKQILENPFIEEMIQFYGRFEYEMEILAAVEQLYDTYQTYSGQMQHLQQIGWLGKLLQAGYEWKGGEICQKQMMGTEELESFLQALTDPDNVGMFGMGLFLQSTNRMEDKLLRENHVLLGMILKAYEGWKERFIWQTMESFGRGGTLTGQSKTELAFFYKYILEN